MGQGEVLKILERSKQPLSRTQIADKLGKAPVIVSKIINRMLKFKDIECVELNRHEAAKLLGWKTPIRRVRFYYVSKSS